MHAWAFQITLVSSVILSLQQDSQRKIALPVEYCRGYSRRDRNESIRDSTQETFSFFRDAAVQIQELFRKKEKKPV